MTINNNTFTNKSQNLYKYIYISIQEVTSIKIDKWHTIIMNSHKIYNQNYICRDQNIILDNNTKQKYR